MAGHDEGGALSRPEAAGRHVHSWQPPQRRVAALRVCPLASTRCQSCGRRRLHHQTWTPWWRTRCCCRWRWPAGGRGGRRETPGLHVLPCRVLAGGATSTVPAAARPPLGAAHQCSPWTWLWNCPRHRRAPLPRPCWRARHQPTWQQQWRPCRWRWPTHQAAPSPCPPPAHWRWLLPCCLTQPEMKHLLWQAHLQCSVRPARVEGARAC